MLAKYLLPLAGFVLSAYACEGCEARDEDVVLTRLVPRMQPDALGAPMGPKGPLSWGQLNVLHTTDTHGWLEGHIKEQNYGADWGDFVSFVKHMNQTAINNDVDFLLVDTGDLHDGAGLSDATMPNGNVSNVIFENLNYDLLAIGNHELYVTDIAYETFSQFSKVYGDRYLTSNVQIRDPVTGNWTYIGHQYRYFKTRMGLNVMAFGFLYDFTGNSNVSRVIKANDTLAQPWFQQAVNNFTQPVDLFILLGHNPPRTTVSSSTFGTYYNYIRKAHPNIPIQIFGGHTHIRDFVVYDNMATGLESGRYCETLGWLSMTGFSHYNKTGPAGLPHPSQAAIKINATTTASSSTIPLDTATALPTVTASPSTGAVASAAPASSNYTFQYFRRYLDWNRLTFEFHANGSQTGYAPVNSSSSSSIVLSTTSRVSSGSSIIASNTSGIASSAASVTVTSKGSSSAPGSSAASVSTGSKSSSSALVSSATVTVGQPTGPPAGFPSSHPTGPPSGFPFGHPSGPPAGFPGHPTGPPAGFPSGNPWEHPEPDCSVQYIHDTVTVTKTVGGEVSKRQVPAAQASIFDTPQGVNVTNTIYADRQALNITTLYGCAPQSWCQTCAPFLSSGNIFSLLADALATVVYQPARQNVSRLIVLNTGSVRFDLFQGKFLEDDSFIVSPFADTFQFIPDVPLEYASGVMNLLNHGSVYKRDEPKLTSRDFGFDEFNLMDRDTCIDPPVTHDSLSKRNYAGGRVLRRQSSSTTTPGYTTTDDFGTDGDDTIHTRIPYYAQPNYFQANVSITSTTTTVDLVFLDYFASSVVMFLQQLGYTSVSSASVQQYLPVSFTTNSYLPAYAKVAPAWQANVPNCPISATGNY